jgi:hypothetical protein
MIYMEPGLSPGYRREEEEEGKEGLEEEEEEASPGFVDSWLRRCLLNQSLKLRGRACYAVECPCIALFPDHPANKEEEGVEASADRFWDSLPALEPLCHNLLLPRHNSILEMQCPEA